METQIPGNKDLTPPSRSLFHTAALWSGIVMLVGLVLGFHFELDPKGYDWGGTLLWAGGAFVVCWALSLIGLFAAYRHRMRFLIFLPLFPLVALVVWALSISSLGGLAGIVAIVPLILLVAALPGIFFGMMVGLLVMRRNGWKLALGLTIIGLVWAGYQFTIPRGDTRDQAIATKNAEACKQTEPFLRDDCYKQVAIAKKDVMICDQYFSRNSGGWVDCYRAAAKAANRTDWCQVGPDGDSKTTCLKEIAINQKDVATCETLPKTSVRPGYVTYHQDCMGRVLAQLAIPNPTTSAEEVTAWCTAATAYPIYLDTEEAQSALTTYCQ